MTGVVAEIPKKQFLFDGEPLASGTLTTTLTGTSTPAATWQDEAQTIANTNPIILDSQGECNLWLEPNVAYRLVLKNSLGATIWTVDNVQGNSNSAGLSNEWVDTALAPTFISVTSFSLVGDQTAIYHVGRRVKITNGASTFYGTILSSAFSTVTTVSISMDSGSMTAALSAVNVGLTSFANSSINTGRKGANIVVAASGAPTIPTNGDYFFVTGTGFNITGFADSWDGRIVTLDLPNGLTLVNSASFLLKQRVNKVTSNGDLITVINRSAGVWEEVGASESLQTCFNVNRNGTATTAIAVATITVIPWTTEDFDPTSAFASNTFTCDKPGRYFFYCQARTLALGTLTGSVLYIYKNGAVVATGITVLAPLLPTTTVAMFLNLNAGDTVDFRYSFTGTGNGQLDGTKDYTFALGYRVA
jgi:hypothetical protein